MSDMHDSITEHISYERGKNSIPETHTSTTVDGEQYFHNGLKRDMKYRGDVIMDEEDTRTNLRNMLINELSNTLTQLEELLYMIGDQPEPPTEDELMNYVIGVIESVKVKKNKVANHK